MSSPTKETTTMGVGPTGKQIGTLVVVVLKAKSLKDNHTFYKQDAYAVIRLGGVGKTTKIDPKGGQHPVWDEEFHFPVFESRDPSDRILKVSCFAKEKKIDQPLGDGEVDMAPTLRSGEFDDWVGLKQDGQSRGEVYLECTYYSAGPPVTRRPSKLMPWDRLARPPPTPPKENQSPASSANSSPRLNPRPLQQQQQQRPGQQLLDVPGASQPVNMAGVGAGAGAGRGLMPQPQIGGGSGSPPRVPSILRPSNPRASPVPIAAQRVSEGLPLGPTQPLVPGRRSNEYARPEVIGGGGARHEQEHSLPNPFNPPLPPRHPVQQQRRQSPPRHHQISAQSQSARMDKLTQEQADEAFARSLAQSEGIDVERLRAEESDAELARRLASEEAEHELPGAWV